MIRVRVSILLSKFPIHFFWGYFVVFCIVFFGVIQPFFTIAQEWPEASADSLLVNDQSQPVPSESAQTSEPISEPVIVEPASPAETSESSTDNVTSDSLVFPEPSSSTQEGTSPIPSWEANTAPEWSNTTVPPTSSVTLIDTGDEIIPIVEWDITDETEEILTLFSNDDVFVEIEIIFSDLDTETDQEIQNEPTLADNTDEDPNVDLIDPSIVADPAGPLPEPETELPPEDTTPVAESSEASQSTIALLESLLEAEELSVRRYEKDIIIDELATHTCRADIFRADVQIESSSRARVTLFQNKKKALPSFLEIGALPAGIDVVFKGNKEYSYTPGTRETLIEFEITRQVGAREWDFTIPIIYTLQEGETSSSVICQINILND